MSQVNGKGMTANRTFYVLNHLNRQTVLLIRILVFQPVLSTGSSITLVMMIMMMMIVNDVDDDDDDDDGDDDDDDDDG